MAFSRSRYADARRSTFNDVGHDQTIVYNSGPTVHNVHIHFSLFGSAQTPHHLPPSPRTSNDDNSNILQPTSESRTSSQRRLVTTHHFSETAFVVETAVGLIVEIATVLIDRRDVSNNNWDFELELKSLRQTLSLTGLAVQEYRHSPLGQSLANTITPEAEQCCAVLRDLLHGIDDTRQGLNSTIINRLWRLVWRERWDGDELTLLRMKLFRIRKSLNGFLKALNS